MFSGGSKGNIGKKRVKYLKAAVDKNKAFGALKDLSKTFDRLINNPSY